MSGPVTDAPRRRPDLPAVELTVADAFDLHAGLRRVIFDAPAFDYRPGQDFAMMLPLPDGEVGRRHYTIRSRDEQGRIAVDFVMHGASPGPEFARNARPGDTILARGPRGRSHLREGVGWHLICADETGLPAALHMMETNPGGRIIALLEVQDDSWRCDLPGGVEAEWLLRGAHRPGPNALILDRITAMTLPEGEGFAVLMSETSNVRAQRQHLLTRGLNKTQIASEGYWRPGRVGGHDHVDDAH